MTMSDARHEGRRATSGQCRMQPPRELSRAFRDRVRRVFATATVCVITTDTVVSWTDIVDVECRVVLHLRDDGCLDHVCMCR